MRLIPASERWDVMMAALERARFRPTAIVDLAPGATVFVRCGRWRRYEDDELTRGSRLTGCGPT